MSPHLTDERTSGTADPRVGASALRPAEPRPLTRGAAALPYVVAAVVTFAVALWTYRPWRLDGVIAYPDGDSLSFHAWILATMETGWYESSDRLAAPFVQNGHTYTVTDELLFALVGKVLGPLTGSAGEAVLWWLILSFPLAALATVGVARYLGIGRLAALVPGILFALLPDHFLRGTAHYSLASTWAVPLGVWMAVSLLRRPRATGRRRALFELFMLASGVAIALTNAYYAVFGILMVAAAGVAGALAARSVRVLASGVARGLSLLVPVVVAMWVDSRYAPDPLGYPSFAVTRSPSDAETYGGKIIAMLLPAPEHRLELFRRIRHGYEVTFPNPAEFPALGLVGAVSFVGLVVWSLLFLWRRPGSVADPRLPLLSGLNWLLLLGYTVGGLGSIWAFLLDGGGIRVWSRLHVYLGLVALLALAVALDRLRRRAVRGTVVAVVLAVGMLDQTTPLRRPPFDEALAVRAEVTELTEAIADREGPTAAVYQLPQVSFPVANRAVAPASPYENMLPFLYSEDLRWSFGGFQGDPAADWQERMAERPVAEQAALLAAAGFSGALVDTVPLASDPALLEAIDATWAEPDLTSTSGRWQYYDLGSDASPCPAPATATLADLALRPPLLYASEGFTLGPGGTWTNLDVPAALRVLTLREGGWPDVDVEFSLVTPEADLRLTFPDGSVRELPAGTDTVVRWSGPVPADGARIAVERTGGAGVYTVGALRAVPVGLDVAPCLAAWQRQATDLR